MKDKPQVAFLNCATGDVISPSGTISDEEIARLERLRRESLGEYREFGATPPDPQ